jgi:hypothetical protein
MRMDGKFVVEIKYAQRDDDPEKSRYDVVVDGISVARNATPKDVGDTLRQTLIGDVS